MITEEESIPTKSDSYLFGQDIFYIQFNDINFYIEDEEQEQLYFQILKKLFSDISLQKIFPLNGKKNVTDNALINLGNKKHIYIVDKDFDDLHAIVKVYPNLFYLDYYCIENYLTEENSVKEFIIEEFPKLKELQILEKFNLDSFLKSCISELSELFLIFYLVQKFEIPEKNCSLHVSKFLKESNLSQIDKNKIIDYKEKINKYIIDNNFNIDLIGELENECERLKISETVELIKYHISGKYIVFILLHKLKRVFSFSHLTNVQSLCYRLAKNCEFLSLENLKKNILRYIN